MYSIYMIIVTALPFHCTGPSIIVSGHRDAGDSTQLVTVSRAMQQHFEVDTLLILSSPSVGPLSPDRVQPHASSLLAATTGSRALRTHIMGNNGVGAGDRLSSASSTEVSGPRDDVAGGVFH
ncbi:hypothetical protein SRHO_G00054310 [Serrasalmus rhombeus]